jgi:hypothetical protein
MENGETDIAKAKAVMDAGDAGLIMSYLNSGSIIKAGAGLEGGPVQLYSVNNGIRGEAMGAALAFTDLASGKIGGKLTSLGDIMFLVAMLSIDISNDQKQLAGEQRRANKEMASKTAEVNFDMKLDAAEKEKEAAILQGTFTIIQGSLAALGGLIQLGCVVGSAVRLSHANAAAQQTPGAGEAIIAENGEQITTPGLTQTEIDTQVKTLQAKASNWGTIGQSLAGMCNAGGQIAQGIGQQDVAKIKVVADKIKASVEVMEVARQAFNEEAAANREFANTAQQQINQTLEMLRRVLENAYSTIQSLISHI